MRVIRICAVYLAAFVILCAAQARAEQDRILYFYNWSDWIGPNVIPEFEKASGVKVVPSYMESDEVLEAKLLAGGSGYDVVVPTLTPFLARGIKSGLYREIDHSKLKNWEKADPELLAVMAKHDPGNRYGVPLISGIDGVAINLSKLQEIMPDAPIDSWRMVFDPQIISRFKGCGVNFPDVQADVIPSALIFLGLDPNSEKKEDLDKAYALLRSVRPYIRTFDTSGYINALAAGDVCLAFAYSSDTLNADQRAREAGKNFRLRFVIPKEGTLTYISALAIPKDAKHYDEALQFIDWTLDGRMGADTTLGMNARSGSAAAREFIPAELLGNSALYPSPEIRRTMVTLNELSPAANRARDRVWTKIKTNR